MSRCQVKWNLCLIRKSCVTSCHKGIHLCYSILWCTLWKVQNSSFTTLTYPFKGGGGSGHHRWLHHQFPLFFSVLRCPLGLGKLQPVHSLMLSSHLFCCLPCLFFALSLYLARWFWPGLMNRRHVHNTSVCIFLGWSGLRLVRLPAGSRHRLPFVGNMVFVWDANIILP